VTGLAAKAGGAPFSGGTINLRPSLVTARGVCLGVFGVCLGQKLMLFMRSS